MSGKVGFTTKKCVVEFEIENRIVVQEADAACRAAIYVRLSVEDTHTHSVSIETQQMIIARYLEQYPEISVYDTYIDNGATGTNFVEVR